MLKRLICLLMLGVSAISLTACVIDTPPPYSRPGAVWIPGHSNGWHWVPGHWA